MPSTLLLRLQKNFFFNEKVSLFISRYATQQAFLIILSQYAKFSVPLLVSLIPGHNIPMTVPGIRCILTYFLVSLNRINIPCSVEKLF